MHTEPSKAVRNQGQTAVSNVTVDAAEHLVLMFEHDTKNTPTSAARCRVAPMIISIW
jgi:hypothetical protein